MNTQLNTRKQRLLNPLSLAVALGLGCTTFAAIAQDNSIDEQADKKGLERIEVTAQRRVSTLQETPIAISAFGEKAIENMGIEEISDLNNIAPNTLIVEPIGSQYNVGVNIRGQGTASPVMTIDPKVGIYVDGVYMARNSGAVLDIIDLERVEVLRGPQGTLWGKNTTGGAISFVTKAPSDEFQFSQKFTVGNFGLFRSLSSIDTGDFDGFSAKVTYMTSEEDGWAKNTFQGALEKDLGAKETDAYRIGLQYLGDSVSVNYNYDNTDGNAVPNPAQVLRVLPSALANEAQLTLDLGTNTFIGGNTFTQMLNAASQQRQDTLQVDAHGREYADISGHNLTVEWDFSDNHTFKSISSYREYEARLPSMDMDGGAYFGAVLDATFQPTGEFAAIPGFHYSNVKKQDQSSQEFQFIGSFMDQRLNYVAGLYYFTEDGFEENPWLFGASPAGSPVNVLLSGAAALGQFYSGSADSTALFAQADYALTDKLNVVFGLRYTKDEKEITLLNRTLDEVGSGKQDWSKTVGSLVLNYVMDKDFTLYGKIVQGYAAGNYNPGSANPLVPVEPEDIVSYEVGSKAYLLDGTLNINAAIFYNDNDNLLVTTFENGVQNASNSGQSETIGFEIDAQYAVTSDLSLSASYGYQDSKYTDPRYTDQDRYSAMFAVNWMVAETDYGVIDFHANYVMNDENQYDGTNPNLVGDAYELLNARLTVSDIKVGEESSLKVALYGRNLTDEEYLIHGINLGAYDVGTFGTPRSYGVEVTFDF